MLRRVLRSLAILTTLILAPVAVVGGLVAAARLPALAVPSQQDLVLSGVTLIDAAGAKKSGVTLRASAGRIVAISDGSPSADPPRYVLPGFIDAHVHAPFLPGDRALWATLYLLHGVTSIRNLGDGNEALAQKRAVALGHEFGPRIFGCGIPIDGEGGTFPARIVRNAKQARAEVEDRASRGADCIKVMSHLSLESFTALREASRQHNLPVVGHMVNAYGDRGIEESGIADVQHLTGVPEVPSPAFDAREWRRFHRAFDTLSEGRIAEVVSASRRRGVIHTPTLVGSAYEVPGTLIAQRQLLPAWYGTLWDRFTNARTIEDRAIAARNLPRYLAIVKALHGAGVPIQAGSDVFPLIPDIVPGAGLQDELRMLNRAGLSPAQAIAAATTVAGALLETSDRASGLGRIRVGGPADLLIFDRDPTQNLDDLSSLRSVIVDGRRYETADLRAQLERQLAASRRFPYSWASRLVGFLLARFA